MALILNIETATPVCSVALCNDGEVIFLKENKEGLSHASLLTVFIEKIFQKAGIKAFELDAIAVSKGPGSYTGLRIGTATAKGICYASGVSLIAINTLQAMAYPVPKYAQIPHNKNILFCPLIDARRMEVYTAFFDKENNIIKKTSASIVNENSFNDFLDNHVLVFFGDGAKKCKPVLTHPHAVFLDNIAVSASSMAQLSEKAFKRQNFVDVAYFEPFYLKEFIATKPKKIL